MKLCVSKLIAGILGAATVFLAQGSAATPVWQLNPQGTGASGAVSLSQVDVGGAGFVQIIPSTTDPTSYQFVENGAYQLLSPGTGTAFSGNDLTVSYSVSGSGSFLNPLALQFTSGTISLYADANYDFASTAGNYGADNGTLIALFNIFAGGVDSSTGLVTVTAALETGSLLAGYFFSADGTDLATTTGTTIELSIYNQLTTPDSLIVSEIICGLAGYVGAGCDGTSSTFSNSPLTFAVRDGGFASVIANVPEPGTILLVLAGLLVIACLTRGSRRLPAITAHAA